MTTEELHKILDDENKKIALKEYQNIIWELRNDTTLMLLDKNLDIKKSSWYMGESNGFQIALDLSEHINQNQKAIECLKEVKEKLKAHCEYTQKENIGWYLPQKKIEVIIDNKIKELEGE